MMHSISLKNDPFSEAATSNEQKTADGLNSTQVSPFTSSEFLDSSNSW